MFKERTNNAILTTEKKTEGIRLNLFLICASLQPHFSPLPLPSEMQCKQVLKEHSVCVCTCAYLKQAKKTMSDFNYRVTECKKHTHTLTHNVE